jgi:hypothetical protein
MSCEVRTPQPKSTDHHCRRRQREPNNLAMSAKGKSPPTSSTVQPQPARLGEGGVLVTGTNLSGYTLAPPSNSVGNDRPRTLYDLAEAQQLLRSCYDEGSARSIIGPVHSKKMLPHARCRLPSHAKTKDVLANDADRQTNRRNPSYKQTIWRGLRNQTRHSQKSCLSV